MSDPIRPAREGAPGFTSGVPLPEDDDELLRRVIDGESTPAEQTLLQRRLEEVPALKTRHDMVRSVIADLERVGLVEPPPGFGAAVVREARRRAARSRQAWWRPVQAAFANRPAFGYASALAAGAVVGALGVLLAAPAGLDTGIDESAAAGTVLPGARLADARLVDRRPLAAGPVRGEASTRTAEPGLVAEVRIDAGSDARITLEFDAKAFVPVAFNPPPGFQGEAVLKAGQLRLTGAGTGTYVLVLAPSGTARPPLDVRVRGPEHMVQHRLETAD